MTLDAMEVLVAGRGRELLRGLVQLSLDARAGREVRLPRVTGTGGVRRGRAGPDHARPVVTRLGEVRVRRIACRSGVRGAGSLFPRDAVLNLPPLGYWWSLQRLAEMFCRAGSYEQAHEFVPAATGVSTGKRQLEQITVAAAAAAERFCRDRLQDHAAPAGAGAERGGSLPPLAISAGGTGVAMLPGGRAAAGPGPRSRRCGPSGNGPGTGEKKGCKPMAGTGCVFGVAVPDGPPRTPGQVMRADRGGEPPARPRAVNRWHTRDITAGRDVTTGKISGQAGRRDPDHLRTWTALAGGDVHQLGLIQAAAAARGVTLAIVTGFIRVPEYPRKTAWCFHAPRDPAREDRVTAQAPDILHGRVSDRIARLPRLARLAADHPPGPGGGHAKTIRKTLHYLTARQPWMDYPRALAEGRPIAAGVIEGACRHLVQDRTGITGARRGPEGTQAMPWLRATNASGDTSAYRDYHITREHQRNHLSRYQPGPGLAA